MFVASSATRSTLGESLIAEPSAVNRTRPADTKPKFQDRPYQFAFPIDQCLRRRRLLLCKAYHPAETIQ